MKLRMTLILLAVALASASYILGQAIFTEFTGIAIGAGPPTDFGTFSCPGGQPTGLFPYGPPCTPGSRVHSRGTKFPYVMQTTDSRTTGPVEFTLNGNFDCWRPDLMSPGSGPMWGTLRLEVEANGVKTGEVWEGNWTGTRTVTNNRVQTRSYNVVHGTGGRIEGLKAEFYHTEDSETGTSLIEGRILAPPGKSGK